MYNKHHLEELLDDPGSLQSPSTNLDGGLERGIVEIDDLFRSLHASMAVRSVIWLRMHDCSEAEVARRLNIPRREVKRHIATAQMLLRRVGLDGSDSTPTVWKSMRSHSGSMRSRPESKRSHPEPTGLHSDRSVQRHPTRTAPRSTTTTHESDATRRYPAGSRVRPLAPWQTFGWRDVYYREVHRYRRTACAPLTVAPKRRLY